MSRKRDYRAAENTAWTLWQNDDGTYPIEQAKLAVLMDIRGELRKLNALLHCSNFTGIPRELLAIKRNTTKRRKKA
jgi:hypothetical protein